MIRLETKTYVLKENWRDFLNDGSDSSKSFACREENVLDHYNDVKYAFKAFDTGNNLHVVDSSLHVEYDMVIEATRETHPEYYL